MTAAPVTTGDMVPASIDHAHAAAAARHYASRQALNPTEWIALYLWRYRRLTGRPGYAGPMPVSRVRPRAGAR